MKLEFDQGDDHIGVACRMAVRPVVFPGTFCGEGSLTVWKYILNNVAKVNEWYDN